jgi:hypothetical protein
MPDLAPYNEFKGARLPDPRKAFVADLAEGLGKIVEAEGPMTVRLALERYRVALDLGKLRGQTRDVLIAAVTVAIRQNKVRKVEDDDPLGVVLAPLNSPDVVLRERGSRNLEDIPVAEIAALAESLGLDAGMEELAFRQILATYDLKRLTELAEARLRRALAETAPNQV